jgi:hypothetical protein
MTNRDKASPGQPFKAPAASTWNAMVDAGEAFKMRQAADQSAPFPYDRPTDLIRVRNDSCGPRRAGEVLKICGSAITTVTDEHKWLTGATTDGRGCFAVLKEAAPLRSIVPAQVSGVCMAYVQVTNESHNRAAIVSGQVTLRSATTGQFEILYKPPGLGERLCVVVIHDSCVTAAATQPVASRQTNCEGSCQWSWVSGAWTLVSNECSPTTTTTGSPTSTTTTTSGGTTSTTTTAAPPDRCGCPTTTTTTTTADFCQCLKPTFCAANDGECTFTSCSKQINEPPECGPTTTTTTTTGPPCNCDTTTTPNPNGNCVWYRDPLGVLSCLNCPPGCLPPPITLDNCDIFVSPPVPQRPPTPPPQCSDRCNGGTLWYCLPGFGWLPEAGAGGYAPCSENCPEVNDGNCISPPPTMPCENCGSMLEACVFVPNGSTTTTGDPATSTTTTTSVYDTSCGICYGSTTSSTTTTGQCEGTCIIKWSGSVWQQQSKTCASGCGCYTPGFDGLLPCHVIEVPCIGTTTTTTSTTTTTTTTTSTSTTTTTTGATEKLCCDYGSGVANCICITAPTGSTCLGYAGVPNCVPTVPFDGTCPTCISPTTTTSTTSTTTTCEPCSGGGYPGLKVWWRCEGGFWALYNNASQAECPEGWIDIEGDPCDTECQCTSCASTTPTS